MSKRRNSSSSGAMLDLWRPPQGAKEPVGCLATTYTFAPGLFEEQCLARFLEIESEPNREDLAFLLERESRLGGVYAGVLVDLEGDAPSSRPCEGQRRPVGKPRSPSRYGWAAG